MKLLNIRNSEVLSFDGKGSRLWRSGSLSRFIYLNREDVELSWIISNFDHYNKVSRPYLSSKVINDEPYYKALEMLPTCGYSRNLSFMRIVDHISFSMKLFWTVLARHRDTDIFFCSFPTVESCFVTLILSRIVGAKFIVDIRDRWPDVFFEKFTSFSLLFKLLFIPYFIIRYFTFRYADSIVATNEDFKRWAQDLSGRPLGKRLDDAVFPIGFSDPLKGDCEDFSTNILKKYNATDDDYIISFGGTLGEMFDFSLVKIGLEELDSAGVKYKFFIFGDGEAFESVRSSFLDNSSVHFMGRVNSNELFSFYTISNLLVAPYFPLSNFINHIPNKISEYLAAGKPIVTSLSGVAGKLLEKHSCGYIYETSSEFADAVRKCIELGTFEMGEKSRELFLSRFQLDNINSDIVKHCIAINGKH